MFDLLVASQSLDTLAGLVNDPNPFTVKVVVQCLTTVYPLLFRMLYGPWSCDIFVLLIASSY